MAEMEMWVSMTPLREFPSCSADILQRAERNDFPVTQVRIGEHLSSGDGFIEKKYNVLTSHGTTFDDKYEECLKLEISHSNLVHQRPRVQLEKVARVLRLLVLMPKCWPYPHYRRQKIEKSFGILFAFIVASFSSADLFSTVRIKFKTSSSAQNWLASFRRSRMLAPQAGSSSGQGTSSTQIIPTKLDSDSKYSQMADYYARRFAITQNSWLACQSGSLKAIEILAATSRHSQIALNSIELTAVLLERLAPQPSPTSSPKKAQLDEPSMNTLPSTGLEGWDPRAFATSSDKMTNRLADRQLKFCQVVKEIIQQMLKWVPPLRSTDAISTSVRQHKAGSNGKEALDEDYLELIGWLFVTWIHALRAAYCFRLDEDACKDLVESFTVRQRGTSKGAQKLLRNSF
ncbi:hypothetical protein H4Q26_013036 [Puccinia striiformis f. sp. tritici PST-130]|nr:hypothetical protein H4Q26_013036 [Puccinia striiformis f. sp. tritici PST-130]